MNASRWFPLFFVLWTLVNGCCCQSNRMFQFRLMSGYRIGSGATQVQDIHQPGPTTLIQCAVICSTGCGMFHYSRVKSVCVVFKERHFDSGLLFTSDSEWTVGVKRISSVQSGEWTLAFRAQAGTGAKVYETWTATGVHHDNMIETDFPSPCLRMNNYNTCDRHFRSHILDEWKDIQQVYMSWVKDDVEVAFIVFDGTGSDRDSWFSPSRILNSTWAPSIIQDESELYLTSIYGFCIPKQCRRFYLHGPHTYCATEWSYAYTVDHHPDWCVNNGWEPNLVTNVPTFLYSPTDGRATIGVLGAYSTPEKADVMAIWVKFA